jgi:RNA polymerase primary sigma factor
MSNRSTLRAAEEPDVLGLYLRDIGPQRLLTPEEERELGREISAGQTAEARLLVEGHSTASRTLRLTVRRGHTARQSLVERNLRLVVMIAKRYPNSGLSVLDLIQEGNIGLLRAADRFDWTKGYRFSTYASYWIRQRIGVAIQKTSRAICLPQSVDRLLPKVHLADVSLASGLGRKPSSAEIADYLAVPTDKVEAALSAPQVTDSLFDRRPDMTTLEERLPDLASGDAFDEVDLSITVDALLRLLTDQEREAVLLRFGFDGERATLRTAGEKLSLSGERVRQIERDSITKLRRADCDERTFEASERGFGRDGESPRSD